MWLIRDLGPLAAGSGGCRCG